MPREVQARVWPTEDFEAALSFVPVAEGEDDLFAGIPQDLAAADALATSDGPVRRPRHPDGACPVNDAPTADGGPGFLAFVAFFVLALALWFLMRNMNARMRRMSYRQQQAHRGPNDPQAAPTRRRPGSRATSATATSRMPGRTRRSATAGPARAGPRRRAEP